MTHAPGVDAMAIPASDVDSLVALVRELTRQNAELVGQVEDLESRLLAAMERAAHHVGQRFTVTVLFADLRDSTALAEELPAERVIDVLNMYLGALARCVLAQGGMVDKFFGDGLMAVFGVLEEPQEGAVQSAHAIQQMRQSVCDLNAKRESSGQPPIQFGVGVHTGEVVFGSVGLPGRSDYTAVGDAVNTAARLSGLCKDFGIDAVLSGETVSRLDSAHFPLRALGGAAIRGKSERILVWTLDG